MNSPMMAQASELAGWNKEIEALSVYQAMQQLEDRRKSKGKRSSLALVLTLIILANMAGETTLQAVADWVRYRSAWLQEVLPDTRSTFPNVATYSTVLRAVDPAQVNQKLMDLLIRVRAQQRVAREQEHIILDGKTLRGTQHHLAEDQQNMHHVTCYEAQTGIVMWVRTL